jgi:hypothetical protein
MDEYARQRGDRTSAVRVAVAGALGAAVCFALSTFFAYAFYVRYWKWRDCIAVVESSCTEPGAGNATEGGMIWAGPAVLFFGVAVILCIRTLFKVLRAVRDRSV